MDRLIQSEVDRYVVVEPETGIRHGLRVYAPRDGRPAVMTLCDYGQTRLGEPAVVRNAELAGRCDCLECLAASP